MRRAFPLAILLLITALAVIVPPAAPDVTGGAIVSGDLAWMMTASGLVLLMTPGLSFFYGGMVQKKNVISTMLQSLIAMIVIHGRADVFLVQLLTLAIAAPYAFVGSWILFRVTDAIIPLRVSEKQELIGLDITQHDETVSTRGVRAAFESLQGELFADSKR